MFYLKTKNYLYEICLGRDILYKIMKYSLLSVTCCFINLYSYALKIRNARNKYKMRLNNSMELSQVQLKIKTGYTKEGDIKF